MINLLWMLLFAVALAALLWWPLDVTDKPETALNVTKEPLNVSAGPVAVTPTELAQLETLYRDCVTVARDDVTGEFWAIRPKGVTRITPGQATLLQRYLASSKGNAKLEV